MLITILLHFRYDFSSCVKGTRNITCIRSNYFSHNCSIFCLIFFKLKAEHAACIEKIDKEYNTTLLEIDSLRESLESIRDNILHLERECQIIQNKNLMNEMSVPMIDTRTSYALSLYSKISNISWDYSSNSIHILEGCKYSKYSKLSN